MESAIQANEVYVRIYRYVRVCLLEREVEFGCVEWNHDGSCGCKNLCVLIGKVTH